MKFYKGIIPLLFTVIAFTLFTCKKGNLGSTTEDALINIPQDISMLTAIDAEQLLEKADWNEVIKMEFFQKRISDISRSRPAWAKVISDPYQSGINLSKKMYIVTDVDPIKTRNLFTSIVFSLDDVAQFEALIADAIKNGSQQTGEGFKYLTNKDNIISWNDQLAVMSSGTEGINLVEKASNFFTIKKENSVAQLPDLKKSLSTNHDVTNWMTSNILADNQEAQFMLGLAGFNPQDLKDNFIHNYIDFDKGEMNGKINFFLQEAIRTDLDLFFKDGVKTDFSEYLPEQPGLLFMGALDFEGINKVVNKRPQAKAMLNFALQEFGLTSEELGQTFGGDLVFANYGDSEGSKTIFSTNLSDQKSLEKMLSLASEYDIISKEKNGLYQINPAAIRQLFGNRMGMGIKDGTQMLIKENLVFFSEDQTILNDIRDGKMTSSNIDATTYQKVASTLFGALFDVNSLKHLSEEINGEAVQDMELFTERNQTSFKMNMVDKQTNSLHSIFKRINQAYLKNANKANPINPQ